RSNMTEFEFFMELRLNGVEQLGQVRLAILETNGQISVYFFENKDVKPGLSILPEHCTPRFIVAPEAGDYACVRCSEVIRMNAGEKQLCPRCANPEWTKASRAKRVV
ncbi:YetF domain-containing protein, partial [Salmonella enterica]